MEDINSFLFGLGTDGINNSKIVKDAIDNGYRFIDTADKYNNLEIISEGIGDNRERVFICHKIDSYLETNNQILIVLNIIKYVDCLMYHTPPSIAKIENDIDYIKTLINQKKVRYVGISNIETIENLKKYYDIFVQKGIGSNFKFIEELFNLGNQHKYEDVLNFCGEKGIRMIGYSALSGRSEGICKVSVNPSYIYPMFNEYSHPQTMKIIKDYNLDSGMTNMAYLASMYNVIQLTVSSESSRIVSNFKNFNESFNLLKNNDEYRNIINEETSGDTSRTNLYNYFNKKYNGYKIWDEILPNYYEKYGDGFNKKYWRNLRSFFDYILEMSLVYKDYNRLNDILKEYYEILSNHVNFTKIFLNIITSRICPSFGTYYSNQIDLLGKSLPGLIFLSEYTIDYTFYKNGGNAYWYVLDGINVVFLVGELEIGIGLTLKEVIDNAQYNYNYETYCVLSPSIAAREPKDMIVIEKDWGNELSKIMSQRSPGEYAVFIGEESDGRDRKTSIKLSYEKIDCGKMWEVVGDKYQFLTDININNIPNVSSKKQKHIELDGGTKSRLKKCTRRKSRRRTRRKSRRRTRRKANRSKSRRRTRQRKSRGKSYCNINRKIQR